MIMPAERSEDWNLCQSLGDFDAYFGCCQIWLVCVILCRPLHWIC